MRKTMLFLIALFLVPGSVFAVDALWDHSETPSVFQYKIYWGTVSGTYTNSQTMDKKDCVPGVHPTAGSYDCKMTINFNFVDNTTYYFVGTAFNYDQEGRLQESAKTQEIAFVKRPDGSTGPKPSPMRDLGIYQSQP